ncbi:PIG-L deacetylase family protein [Luteolibacter marinus]|uniref:PIG-L deacetylase family protein n=1 Tax=Luteolibacter marinus TaxID=2776705 RepID=UPI00186927BA|nr:PIG-L deacetylase family protein [Luteolibacter marinus]
MWSKLSQRLTDPLFYRKRSRQLLRPFFPPRPPRPVELATLIAAAGPVAVFIAHPDDELFASCLLCELAARGKAFHLICLTRGEGGVTGDSSREELGRRREAELRASAAALGAASVSFLGHIDPLGQAHRVFAPAVPAGELASQVRSVIEALRPSLLITHGSGGEYWHPAHLLIRSAVMRANSGHVPVLTLHAWQSGHALPGLLNRDDPADLVIDGVRHRDQRLAAFRAHRSQHEYFAGHGGGTLEGYVDRTAREAFRHYPADT